MSGRKYQREKDRAKEAALRSRRICGIDDSWLDVIDAQQPRQVFFRNGNSAQPSDSESLPVLRCRGWVISLGGDGGGLIATVSNGDIVLSAHTERDQKIELWDDLNVEYKPNIRRRNGGSATSVTLRKRNRNRPSHLSGRCKVSKPRRKGGRKPKRRQKRAKR